MPLGISQQEQSFLLLQVMAWLRIRSEDVKVLQCQRGPQRKLGTALQPEATRGTGEAQRSREEQCFARRAASTR